MELEHLVAQFKAVALHAQWNAAEQVASLLHCYSAMVETGIIAGGSQIEHGPEMDLIATLLVCANADNAKKAQPNFSVWVEETRTYSVCVNAASQKDAETLALERIAEKAAADGDIFDHHAWSPFSAAW